MSNWTPIGAHGHRLACASLLLLLLAHWPGRAAAQACTGDCNGDEFVVVTELIRGVNIALGDLPLAQCTAFDQNGDGEVAINELVAAVNSALNGCTAVPQGTMVLQGLVLQVGSGGSAPSPVSDGTVRATVDRNRNGQVEPDEAVSGATDSEGAYRLNVRVTSGDPVVVGFHTDNAAALYRTLEGAPDANVILNATLYPVADLTCTNARCALDDGGLSVDGLPEGVSGTARVFNPVTDTDAFPGEFADDAGNLLVSGVFAAVDLTDDAGQPVTDLAEAATLRMRMPRDTWSLVEDIQPGNGQIDVPLYAFDPDTGVWTRQGQGVLEDGDRNVLAEGVLGSIRDGSYRGAVVARGAVQHFSYWNVDWPIDTRACLTGVVLDDQGKPAVGATVTVRGVTYTGTSPSQTVGADGRFCVDVMRSERPGESIDQDSVLGETQRVAIRISYAGKVYNGGEYDTPTGEGACGQGGCKDIGPLRLTADTELQPTRCTFTGVVRDPDGQPVTGATVLGWDQTVDSDLWFTLCFSDPMNLCQIVATTDARGEFTLTTIVLDGLFYYASVTKEEPSASLYLSAQGTVQRCQPINIALTTGLRFTSPTVTVTRAGVIEWTPSQYGATVLDVASDSGETKWAVYSGEASFPPPVTYGVVPTGAEQAVPFGGGRPAALASGDIVQIVQSGTSPDGFPYVGQGSVVVP
jgi:hypothetical protein